MYTSPPHPPRRPYRAFFGSILLACLTLSAVGGGCTRYGYDIVEPADLAGPVGTERAGATTFEIDPVGYEMIAANDRLVIFVHNDASDPVKLLGEDSFAVDPRGESHPLETQTIAPGSSMKLILPRLPPRLQRVGPSFGFGVGVGYGHGWRRGHPYGYGGGYGYDDYPRYYRVEDDGNLYWDWEGETVARLRLVYERDGEQLPPHDFVFARRKI